MVSVEYFFFRNQTELSLAKDELQKRLDEMRREKEAAETSRDHAITELDSAMERLLEVENKVCGLAENLILTLSGVVVDFPI